MMCGLLLDACMKLGLSERERKGVYGLGGLWRIVWCMEIGAIGVVRHCFSFLEGLAGPEKSIRHARYAYIVRPFFTAGGIEPEEI